MQEYRPQWPKLTLEDCRARIQRDPKDLEARMILGMAYRLQGDHRVALDIWNSILDIDPSHEPAKQLVRSLHAEHMKAGSRLE